MLLNDFNWLDVQIMRIYDYFFAKRPAHSVDEKEKALLLSQTTPNNYSDKQEGREAAVTSGMKAVVPADVAHVIYAFFDPNSLADAQGRVALAEQYTHYLGLDESFLKSQTDAQEKFIDQQKSVENVLSYLLKYHPSLLGSDVKFRDIKLNRLTLNNPAVDAKGCYIIDTTGVDFLALQATFESGMSKKMTFFTVVISNGLLIFLSLFFSMKRNLMFCPVSALGFFSSSSGSSNELSPARAPCYDDGPRNGAWGCGDFLPVPDICLEEHNYCPAGSFANAAWVYLATSLDPEGNLGVGMSCSYSNQVGFMIGLGCFALSLLVFVGFYYKHCSETLPTPACLKDHWKNIQSFFAEDKASYTVPPSSIDPNADVERIMVVSS